MQMSHLKNKFVSSDTKYKIYCSMIRTVEIYISETWKLKKSCFVFEREILRKIIRLPKKN